MRQRGINETLLVFFYGLLYCCCSTFDTGDSLKRTWNRRAQRHKRRVHSENKHHQRNRKHVSNEDRAAGFLDIATRLYGIFDRIDRKPDLDSAGIDFLAICKVRNREFRLFIQHKSGESYRHGFEFRNPCVIMWVVDETTDVLDALVDLLQSIIKWLEMRSNQMSDFFNEKLQKLQVVREKSF